MHFRSLRHNRLQIKNASAVALCVAALALILGVGAGCIFDAPGTVTQLQQEIDQQKLALKACEQEKFECAARCEDLKTQIANQPRLASVELDDLFVVDAISIPSRSGGIDLDGSPGDDGVIVYVQPIDAAGDVIKAAGAITIQLTDLTQVGSPRSIATAEYTDPDVIKKSWYGGFMTNHYSLKIPFPDGVGSIPKELHVRVVFFDWLTGREFTASTTVSVDAQVKAAE